MRFSTFCQPWFSFKFIYFSDIVKAAHLRPVKKRQSGEEEDSSSAKGDSCESCNNAGDSNGSGSSAVWNPLAANKKFSQLDEMENDVYAVSLR